MDNKKLRDQLIRRTNRYASGVDKLYDQALADIARLFALVDYDPTAPFSFAAYGKMQGVDEIMQRLESQVQSVVDMGVRNEYATAYGECEELIRQVVRENVQGQMMQAFAPKTASGTAAKRFLLANQAGDITASQRVWNGAVLGQMETAVQEGLMEGMPAKRMATQLKRYLVEPDNYFRRFRIKTGESETGESIYGRKWKKRIRTEDGSFRWIDADPDDYPSGQGIYHSSYKNALRYTRTTTNIAYRTADYDRYQELPFVIGIEIRLSNNPKHVPDVCDDLAGQYPKDFKWTGWHPNCMCYQIPLLAKKDEVDQMVDAVLDGRDPEDVECRKEVTEMPENFKNWLLGNEQRMKGSASMPYFIRDNTGFVSSILSDTKFAKELIEKYGLTIPKHIDNPLSGLLFADITGGLTTTAAKGITALINSYYAAQSNAERVVILKKLISNKGFEELKYHSTKEHSVYGIGMKMFDKKLREGEMPKNLAIAKKMLLNGYDVYMLPNPNSSVSADFILHKKGKLYYTEGKTLNGKNSLDHRLASASNQSSRVIIDVIGTNDARYIANTVASAFEQDKLLNFIILLKGSRAIEINRDVVLNKKFEVKFRSIWNRSK